MGAFATRLARVSGLLLAGAVLAACDPTVVAGVTDAARADASVTIASVGRGSAYPLGSSYRPGCPVAPAELVAVEFDHWTDDGGTSRGVLIVHRDVAADVTRAVDVLFRDRFPLTQARPIDDFGGDDEASMAADNTSAFNCRTIAGTSTWSEHAYGRAIDINPRRNPYVRGSTVQPPAGRDWLDRGDVRPGMLVEGRAAVKVFDRLGWGWGGRWTSAKDHQHVSTTGR